MNNGLSLVTHVQLGLPLLDKSFWNIVFFQADKFEYFLPQMAARYFNVYRYAVVQKILELSPSTFYFTANM